MALLRKANIDETNGNTVGASIARPLDFDVITSGQPMVAPTNKP